MDSDISPGPFDGGHYIKITEVPRGVSNAQVVLLFTHTARAIAEKGQKYEFEFAELCPVGGRE